MIARTWIGSTRAADADQYLRYMHETGITGLRETPGNLGVLVRRSISGDVATFELTSFWESEDAIRQVAGPDIRVARYYPEDARYLLEKRAYVSHADVVFQQMSSLTTSNAESA
jgi:hypothetical protein